MPALDERFEMRLDKETLARVDAWRSRQEDLPSRSEAVRELTRKGLSQDESVKFTSGETLLIHMMIDLAKAHKVKSEFDLDLLREALIGGHTWGLEWEYPFTFSKEVDSPQSVKFVVDTLDMWNFIEMAYAKLDKQEKARVEKEAAPFGKDPKFKGFDGNNETEYMSIARFLIKDMGRWPHFKGRGLNSHSATLEQYGRMLKVFLPMRATLSGGAMTGTQIIKVLQEITHPSMRKEK